MSERTVNPIPSPDERPHDDASGSTKGSPEASALSSYRTIAAPVHTELIEKKSRFLCTLTPVTTEEQAAEQLAAVRKAHPDASHHCSALRLRTGVERASDDGEPSGTAGRPMLHVLQKQQLTDVQAIVTRYFGGTLLGAGGLLRAYTQAVVDATNAAQIAVYLPHVAYRFPLAYAEYDHALRALTQDGWELTAEFQDVVHACLITPQRDQREATAIIQALTRDVAAGQPACTLLRPVLQGSGEAGQ